MSQPRRTLIFLAEDNPADVYLIREALYQSGLNYELDVAEDGERASAHIERYSHEQAPDLIVLDLNLPRLNGSELLALVRRTDTLRGIPVVIFTSSDSPYDRDQAARLGATLYLRKPSNLDEFMKVGEQLKDLMEE
ncbi:MAG TPA: response regulator [Bryobacteraceae bacterium]|jgi:CheY-like chemotaxis protein|nr:response regulator [Bryobacteraceae bacterium]